MRYNIHSFRIFDFYEGPRDFTSTAHSFLEKEYNIITPTFDNLDIARRYAREAARYIANKVKRIDAEMIFYSISGIENDTPTIDIRKADFYETHAVNINALKDE